MSASRASSVHRRPLGLALRLCWGDLIVGEHFLHPGRPAAFSVGSAEGVDFAMSDSKLGAPRFEAVTATPHGFELHFTARMRGVVLRRGEQLALDQLIESGHVEHDGARYRVGLDPEDSAWIDLGGVSLEVRFQPVPRTVRVPLEGRVDFRALNVLLVVFSAAAFFAISADLYEGYSDGSDEEPRGASARIAQLVLRPAPTPQPAALQSRLATAEGAAPVEPAPSTTRSPPTPRRGRSPGGGARAMVAQLFGGGGGGALAALLGPGGFGGALANAATNLVGWVGRPDGMPLRGSGEAGGPGGDLARIGGIATGGRGRGGSRPYLEGRLRRFVTCDVMCLDQATASAPDVIGDYDKELIRKVIQRNRNQIRYCYENELIRSPSLAGKVVVRFAVSPAGAVVNAQVSESTAGNAGLEGCVSSRVSSWVFPAPRGRGLVVTYPFLFRQTAQ